MENGVASLETLVQWYEDFAESTVKARSTSQRCRDYYHGKQLTEEEISTLKGRKQPPVVFNRIQPKMDFLIGVDRQNRTDPKAFPRTPGHEDGANAATDSIRYVCDNTDFDMVSSDVFENTLIDAYGGVVVEIDKKKEIQLTRVPWDRIFYDPHSREKDFSDARYMGIITWMDMDEAKAKWPKAEAGLDQLSDQHGTFEDQPAHWFDGKGKRFMAAEIYFRWQGVWHRAVFTKGALLEPIEPSKYLDEDGEPDNAIILESVKVTRQGERQSAVEILLDIQDEINKRRSKSLHASNTHQTWSKHGAMSDAEVTSFKKEAQKPDGHLLFPQEGELGKDFGIVPNDGMSSEQFSMYQEAVQQIDSVSANAALAGKTDGDPSGRAIQALQQGGMTELAQTFDVHAGWKKRVYRAVWNRIRQFWDDDRWIRVTDDEDNVRFVGLNHAVTFREKLEREHGEIPPSHPINQDPRLDQPFEIENQVAEMDVDILIEDVPDVVNLQSEQFDVLARLYEANPNGIPWEAVIKASTLRNKREILEPQQAPDPLQQQATQLELAGKQADIQNTEADTALKQVETQSEALQAQALQTVPVQGVRVTI